MDTLFAFMMGEANRHRELMVFDWDKAAQLIKENHPEIAGAGLSGDWEWTGDIIYANGKPVYESCPYLASTWATPELELDGEIIPCYKMQHEVPDWGCYTKWPQSALNILKGAEDEKK